MSCPSTTIASPPPAWMVERGFPKARHYCSVAEKGHRAAHCCDCGYEWTDETRRVLLDDEGPDDPS